MKLRKVIAVHHGEYNRHKGSLTPRGIDQVSQLAEAIKDEINGSESRVRLLTSPRRHAVEAAKIVGEQIGVTPELCAQLQLDYRDYNNDTRRQREVLLDRAIGYDIIVTISHAETASGIIHSLSKKFFGPKSVRPEKSKGQAICLSFDSGEVSYLPG